MWIGHRKEILIIYQPSWKKNKLSCYISHQRSTTVSLETYPSIHRYFDIVMTKFMINNWLLQDRCIKNDINLLIITLSTH